MGVIMRSTRFAFLAASAALALTGCGSPRTIERSGSSGLNCTMCHGQPVASFDPETDLTLAAPPVGTGGGTQPTDLDVGQHQAHLNAGPFALAFACETCHVVPTDLGHASQPVLVTLRGAGQALLPADLGTYDATAHTCATYCHGSGISGGTPATKPPSWTGSFSNCDACHGLPPHSGSSDLTTCATCHPDTMSSGGTLIVAGGKHVNGRIDVVGGHLPGYGDPTSPDFHGPDALAYLEQQPGATDCASCHGADLGGGVGPSCTGCHATTTSAIFPSGVSDWKTNCTFCHGTPTGPSFDEASQLAKAAPPDDVSGRLTGTNTAAKTGAHQLHLAGSAVAPAFSCATCHPVPTQATPLARSPRRRYGAGDAGRGGPGLVALEPWDVFRRPVLRVLPQSAQLVRARARRRLDPGLERQRLRVQRVPREHNRCPELLAGYGSARLPLRESEPALLLLSRRRRIERRPFGDPDDREPDAARERPRGRPARRRDSEVQRQGHLRHVVPHHR